MAQHSVVSTQEGSFEHIPVIDLSVWKSPHCDERKRLAQQVYDACTRVGFFYIKVTNTP